MVVMGMPRCLGKYKTEYDNSSSSVSMVVLWM